MSILRIKEAVSLPSLIAEYVTLRSVGPEHIGLCPFHEEKTPSFRVHLEYFKCFGCGAVGDAIDFVSLIDGVSKGRAIRLLSERTGIPLDGERPTRLQKAYSAEEYQFSLWWWNRTIYFLSLQLTAYVCRLGYPYAGTTDAECEEISDLLKNIRALNQGADRRQKMIAAVLRLSTAEDRGEWESVRVADEWLTGFAVECVALAHAPLV